MNKPETALPEAPGPDRPRRGKVLIVDDDPAMRLSLSALLADDFEVSVAIDVPAAEQELRAGGFDVVLSDYDLPGEDGLSFLGRLSRTWPGVMGILVTGRGQDPIVRSAETDESVVRVIAKPYDPGRLIRWVESTVKLARMRQALNAITHHRPRRSKGEP